MRNQVSQFRADYGLTQQQLGTVVGRSRGTVANWESGATPIDPSAARLLQMLNDAGDRAKVFELANGIRTAERELEDATEAASETYARMILQPPQASLRPIHPNNPDNHAHQVVAVAEERAVPLAALGHIVQRDLTVATDAALVGQPRGDWSDPLHLHSRLARIGADYRAVPNLGGKDFVAVTSEDPVVAWVTEGGSLPEAASSFARHDRVPKTCGAKVVFSRLLVSAAGAEIVQQVTSGLLRSLARKLDAAALVGTGEDGEPAGILSTAGIGALDAAGAFDAAVWAEAVEALEDAGVDTTNLGAVAGSSVKRPLTGITHDGRDFWRYSGRVETCGGVPAMAHAACPDDTLLIGDFSRLQVRYPATLDVRTYSYGSVTGDVTLLGLLDAYVSLPTPAAFIKVTNLTT